MIARNRRNFLKGSGFAIGALAAESRAALAAGAAPDGAFPALGPQAASFGWEVCNLSGDGANTYVEVRNKMILETVEIDVSATILTAKESGFAEVLCVAGRSLQTPPTFTSSEAAYINFPESKNFGPVVPDNPHRLTLVQDGALLQHQFLSIILKTWVPPGGAGCATSRHVSVSPGLSLDPGDYLVFHMDHAGVPVDAEMQIAITYQLLT